MKYFLVLIVCFATAVSANEPDKDLHIKCIYPAVSLSGKTWPYGESIQGWSGSGVITRSEKIDDKRFLNVCLTCDHVICGEVCVNIPRYKDWSTFVGYEHIQDTVVVDRSNAYDLAVVVFESKVKLNTVDLDFDSKIYFSTDILKVGFGMSDTARLDYGQISSLKEPIKQGVWNYPFKTNVETIVGDSGGPVFFKENYKLLGLIHAIKKVDGQYLTGHSFVIPLAWLKTWSVETKNELDFVFDKSLKIPHTVAEYKKINFINNLKKNISQLETDIENKKRLKVEAENNLKKAEEGSPIFKLEN